MDKIKKIKELESLFKSGLLSQDEYIRIRADILESGSPSQEDQAEKKFREIIIFNQTWMAENLSVCTFRNGDKIMELASNDDWTGADEEGIPGWCYYLNDPLSVQKVGDLYYYEKVQIIKFRTWTNEKLPALNPEDSRKFGKLYNWHAVNDPRGLAPEGWRIPTKDDWNTLANNLGDDFKVGAKIKEAGSEHWEKTKEISTNDSGFTALPAGEREYYGQFVGLGYKTIWWTNTIDNKDRICFQELLYNSSSLLEYWSDSSGGFSVRCIKG